LKTFSDDAVGLIMARIAGGDGENGWKFGESKLVVGAYVHIYLI
jgi:hypothetical protein